MAFLPQVSAHPGVGPIRVPPTEEGKTGEGETRVHAYYQWVPMVLVLQAVIYYFPIWLWKRVDRGFFKAIICDLDKVHINDYTKEVSKLYGGLNTGVGELTT